MKSATLLKIAAVAVLSLLGVSRVVAQQDDIDSKYDTEGKLKVHLKSGFGEGGVPLPEGIEEPTWYVCALEALVINPGFHGAFIDLNANGKYDKGEGIWSSANIVKKKMTEKEVDLFLLPGTRVLTVVKSGLTDIDLSQLGEELTSLNLAGNQISNLDISALKNLQFLDLDGTGVRDLKLPAGVRLPLKRIQVARNFMDVFMMHRLVEALWNHTEAGTSGQIWLGDMTDKEEVKIAKKSYELLKSKGWRCVVYEALWGKEDGNLGEEFTDGQEQFTEWVEKHVVDDPEGLGVEAIANSSLKAYPTVADSQVTVEAARGEAQRLAMYDMNGALVATAEFNGRATIDVQDMPNGMYLIRVNNQTLRVQVAH